MQDYMPQKKDINGTFDDVYVKQYDNKSRLLQYQIIDKDLGADFPMFLQGCTARMYVDTGTEGVLITGEIADGDNGIINFLLPNSATQNPGVFPCEIRITDPADGSIVSTKSFQLHVQPSIFDDNGFEGNVELSALQQALNTVDGMDNRIKIISNRTIDSDLYVKPLWLGESDGFAAQGITYIGANRYMITFSSFEGNNSKIAIFDKSAGIIAEAEGAYGHANSVAMDGSDNFYIPADDGLSVNRFKIALDESGESPALTINSLDAMTFDSDVKVWSVFDYNSAVYAYGVKSNRYCVWELTSTQPAYMYIIFPANTYIALPNEAPRTNQSWATDGTYLYWLRSNPNAIAIFDFKTGEFIRWSEIGDFVGGSMMIGEAEMICFAENEAKLISQYYYPNGVSTAKRFWLYSDIKWSKDLPAEQQHWYPNESRAIYVSNAYSNGISVRTNQGDTYPKNIQTGTHNYPYPSLETALYAAMATPSNSTEIIMLNTGEDYEIDDLVLRIPSMNIVITCEGKVTFDYLHIYAGNVSVRGNCHFKRLSTSQYSRLQITDGTFTAAGLVYENGEYIPPYSMSGVIGIVNGKYTGNSNDAVFEFKIGATGVVGFSEGNPMTTNYQQTNLVMLNVRNSGVRERWTNIYSGGSFTIGTAITPTISGFYVNNNTVYAVKWRADSNSDFFNTIVHVSGNTIADLSAIIDDNGTIKYRMARIRFRPRIQQSGNWIYGNIVIISITDYTVSDGSITSTALNAVPNGFSIDSIAVKGY